MEIRDSVFVYRSAGGEQLSWHGRYHAHEIDEYEIHFFLEGQGSFLCNSSRKIISGGKIFLTGPNEFHSIIPDAVSVPITYFAVLFSFSETDPADLILHLKNCLEEGKQMFLVDSKYRFQFEELLQMSRSDDPALKESAVHLLISLLYRFFGRFSGESSAEIRSAEKGYNVHTEKALLIMQKYVRENMKISGIAQKIGLSEEHFIRVFRKDMRMTPHQYFLRLKIEGASGLLMSSDKNVGEISDYFGFENQFHFSRMFKKCTGLAPVVYRQTYLQKVDLV
ncbi:MAG: AraC family transcriptional regulator [Treponema sp.]|nr:AraC family transcriptional regulator [Treponema sp.]